MLAVACHSNKNMTGMEKSEQYKEKLNRKKKEDYKKNSEKARKKQYNIQAENTKKNWDLNKQKSDSWRDNQFHKKSLSYRIRKFFDIFERESKPDKGLFSKKPGKKKKKGFFKRIFKRNKKKK